MDDRRRRQKQQQHSAVDEVMNLMIKANRDLSIVQRRLDQEFQATYPEHVLSLSLKPKIPNFLNLGFVIEVNLIMRLISFC